MSRRQRQLRDKSVRLRVARRKVLRRRARLAAARPAAAAATVAALTMAGVGVPTDAVATTSAVANSRVAGAALATCGDPHTPTSNLSDFVDVGGRLFFTADDGVHGAGAVEVGRHRGRHRPGQGHQRRARRERVLSLDLTDVGGTLFFTADDGIHGRELWKSDGTEAGTVLVKDIDPGAGELRLRPVRPDRRRRDVVLHRRRRHPRP